MSAAESEVTELPASPGARLRREREARGLTQQQAAEQLTLDIGVVTALEANDFAALGAPVFAKGHLRRYAALLELPEDDVLGAYERSKARVDQPTLVPRARIEMAPVRGPSRWPLVVGGVAAFLLAAGLVAYYSAYGFALPWARGGSSEAAPAATPAAAPSNAAPSTQAVVPSPAAAGDAAPVSPVAVPGGQVNLLLRFAADSWVEVYDGAGKAVLYDLGKSGTERALAGVAPLSVTIGNAPAVTVAVNGRTITPPALPAGQTVARFSVGPDGSVR